MQHAMVTGKIRTPEHATPAEVKQHATPAGLKHQHTMELCGVNGVETMECGQQSYLRSKDVVREKFLVTTKKRKRQWKQESMQ